MSADVLRDAAALMRERAEAAAEPWYPWGDKSLPIRSGMQAWSDDMKGYLGGKWSDHAASWHPAVALAVADWLDREADLWEKSSWYPDSGESLAVARAYLGTTP